jgi:signal transduction histidine kinase
LHDNIGARLSHIISSLDIQLFKENGANEIAIINAFAKETMNQLRETIWAVGDKTIFFSELKQRIEHYVTQTNSISIPEIRFLDNSSSDFELSVTETINLFRITQESINNALKYGSSKEIKIGFREVDSVIFISIIDDGVGFNIEEMKNRGSGLHGIKTRAKEIDVPITIDSKLDIGTEIKLELRIR